jgi:acetylornithine deacetylase/succinyl-diaminopimelate desuccinylase-like protein
MLRKISWDAPSFKYTEPRVTMSRPTQKLNVNHPFVQKAIICGTTVLGHNNKPVVKSMPFWCDAAFLGQAGIPSIVFGPSGEGLHAKEEWVYVDSLRQMDEIYTLLALDFCS